MSYPKRKGDTRALRLLCVLLVVSLVALFLPRAWSGRLMSLMQVMIPFQWASTTAADAVARAVSRDPDPPTQQEHASLGRANKVLEHQVAALTARLLELQQEVDLLTATRSRRVEGVALGESGRLLPARIVAADVLDWRSSRLIHTGALQGVRRGAAVVSQWFTIDQGDTTGLRRGMAILLGEALVGVVEQVGTHSARVKLLSDVSTQMKVRIGRLTSEGCVLRDRYYWLTGRGGSRMDIRDAERRDVEAGQIKIGDIVLSDPLHDMLPAAMTIGTIEAIEPDHDSPLLSILQVRSAVDFSSLRRVYVYDPQSEQVSPHGP